MWGLDCEESWAPKNWCFWTVVLEKTLESPLDCKEIQPVHSEWDQPWDFFGRNDVKAETPVLWSPHAKSWLIGKDSDAGRDWGQEEKGTTEDEMVGWHYGLDGRESEWTPGVGDGREAWRAAIHGVAESRTQHHSSEASVLQCSAFFTVQLSHPYMTTGKNIALTRQTLVGKVISLLLNMLSRLVITFLPRCQIYECFHLGTS